MGNLFARNAKPESGLKSTWITFGDEPITINGYQLLRLDKGELLVIDYYGHFHTFTGFDLDAKVQVVPANLAQVPESSRRAILIVQGGQGVHCMTKDSLHPFLFESFGHDAASDANPSPPYE